MPTQTIELPTILDGETGLTVNVYPAGSDTAFATAQPCTAATNRDGLFTCTLMDSSGTYFLQLFTSGGVHLWDVWVRTTNTTETFTACETRAEAEQLDAAISSRQATFAYTAPDNAGVAAVKVVTDKLAEMVTGSSPNFAFDTAALANAPTGGGGGGGDTATILAAINTAHARLQERDTSTPSKIIFYVGETHAQTVPLGTNSLDGVPLWFCVDAAQHSRSLRLSVTPVSGELTVTLPADMTSRPFLYDFSLKYQSTGALARAPGHLHVQPAPKGE